MAHLFRFETERIIEMVQMRLNLNSDVLLRFAVVFWIGTPVDFVCE